LHRRRHPGSELNLSSILSIAHLDVCDQLGELFVIDHAQITVGIPPRYMSEHFKDPQLVIPKPHPVSGGQRVLFLAILSRPGLLIGLPAGGLYCGGVKEFPKPASSISSANDAVSIWLLALAIHAGERTPDNSLSVAAIHGVICSPISLVNATLPSG